MFSPEFQDLINRESILRQLKLVKPDEPFNNHDEFIGCSRQEVIKLEEQMDIKLPIDYQIFLLLMGKGAGKFLRGSDCFYQHLPYLKDAAIELLEENNFSKCLPSDAFVFFMHQGYQFSFFRLSEGDHPPIYFYCEGETINNFIKSHDEFFDFLKTEIELFLSTSKLTKTDNRSLSCHAFN